VQYLLVRVRYEAVFVNVPFRSSLHCPPEAKGMSEPKDIGRRSKKAARVFGLGVMFTGTTKDYIVLVRVACLLYM